MKKKFISCICLFLFINILIPVFSDVSINEATVKKPIKIAPLEPTYIAHDAIRISSDEDFETYGFPGSGTENDPYMIAGYEISSPNIYTPCITISRTTAHFVIRDCELYSDQDNTTFSLYHVADYTAKVINNSILNSKYDPWTRGLSVRYSDGVLIKDNYFNGGEIACRLYRCDNVLVFDNQFNTDQTAIEMDGCLYSNITKNSIFEADLGLHTIGCNFLGIYNNTIQYSVEHAMYIGRTANSFIAGNYIFNTTIDTGIQFTWSDNNTVFFNWFEDCKLWGVWTGQPECKSNIFHRNIFINNAVGFSSSQASDSGTGTLWYDVNTLDGNYWSDASGGPYTLAGSASNSDPYPLAGIPLLSWDIFDVLEYPDDDAYEENDYYFEATPLALNDEYTFVMLDEDYFQLSLERFQTLNVTIHHSQFEETTWINLFNSSHPEHLPIIKNVDPGDGFSFEYDCLETDVYYLLVAPISFFGIPVTTYELNITAEYFFDVDDIYEDNDIFNEAAEYDIMAPVQELIYADKDFYKLTLEKRNEITVNITFDSLDVDLDIYLLPHDFTGNIEDMLADILASSTTATQSDEFTFSIGEDNDHIICVSSKDLNGIPVKPIDYTFRVLISIPTEPTSAITVFLTLISLFSVAIIVKKFKSN